MMRCNLSVLLAERNLKITKVSHDTGISRTTLTSLCYNHAKGIQFDTFNSLCMYLKVTPDQLMAFIPVDIELKDYDHDALSLEIKLNSGTYRCTVSAETLIESYEDEYGNNEIASVEIVIHLLPDNHGENQANENKIIKDAFRLMPTSFLSDLEYEIVLEAVEFNEIPSSAHVAIFWYDGLDKGA